MKTKINNNTNIRIDNTSYVYSYGYSDWKQLFPDENSYGNLTFDEMLIKFLDEIVSIEAQNFVIRVSIKEYKGKLQSAIFSFISKYYDSVFLESDGYFTFTLNSNHSEIKLSIVHSHYESQEKGAIFNPVEFNFHSVNLGYRYFSPSNEFVNELHSEKLISEYVHSNTIQTNTLDVEQLYINGHEFHTERHRTFFAYDHANYLAVGQTINLNLNGYTTGQIEKLICRFSEYSDDNNEALNRTITTTILCNSRVEGYDGFYDTHSVVCSSTNTNASINDLVIKSFNLNTDFTLHGYSGNTPLDRKVVLRSIEVVIDATSWGNNFKIIENDYLKSRKIIRMNNIEPDEKNIYLKNQFEAYDIYNMSEEELTEFKLEYEKCYKI